MMKTGAYIPYALRLACCVYATRKNVAASRQRAFGATDVAVDVHYHAMIDSHMCNRVAAGHKEPPLPQMLARRFSSSGISQRFVNQGKLP